MKVVKLDYCNNQKQLYPWFLWLVLFFVFGAKMQASVYNKHIIPLNQHVFDATAVMPGDTIFIASGVRKSLRINSIKGDSARYIVVTNGGDEVVIENQDIHYGLVISQSSYFRLTGSADNSDKYRIRILGTGKGGNGLSLDDFCTDYEVDHIEIANTGFAGIFAFTHPTCDLMANRGNFVQRNTVFRNNYIHDTAGEGMYIGHSFYNGYTKICDGVSTTLYPHEIHGLKVFDNKLENNGYDGIQVSCAAEDTEIFNNVLIGYGKKNETMQQAGIQIGAGSKVRCYNNVIFSGSGTGIMMFGFADSYFYNNLIVGAGNTHNSTTDQVRVHGIFIDDRCTLENTSFYLLNNTIISPKADGIRFYSTISKKNLIANNLILNPGAMYTAFSSENKFVNIKSGVDVQMLNNVFSNYFVKCDLPQCVDSLKYLLSNLPLYKQGIEVSWYGIYYDLNMSLRNPIPSVGCYEYSETGQSRIFSNNVSLSVDNMSGNMSVFNHSEDTIKYIELFDLHGRVVMKQITEETSFFQMNIKQYRVGSPLVVRVKTNKQTISVLIPNIL